MIWAWNIQLLLLFITYNMHTWMKRTWDHHWDHIVKYHKQLMVKITPCTSSLIWFHCAMWFILCCNIWDVLFRWVCFLFCLFIPSLIFSKQSGESNSIWAIQSRGYLTLHNPLWHHHHYQDGAQILQTVLPFLYSFVSIPVKWTFCWSQ